MSKEIKADATTARLFFAGAALREMCPSVRDGRCVIDARSGKRRRLAAGLPADDSPRTTCVPGTCWKRRGAVAVAPDQPRWQCRASTSAEQHQRIMPGIPSLRRICFSEVHRHVRTQLFLQDAPSCNACTTRSGALPRVISGYAFHLKNEQLLAI